MFQNKTWWLKRRHDLPWLGLPQNAVFRQLNWQRLMTPEKISLSLINNLHRMPDQSQTLHCVLSFYCFTCVSYEPCRQTAEKVRHQRFVPYCFLTDSWKPSVKQQHRFTAFPAWLAASLSSLQVRASLCVCRCFSLYKLRSQEAETCRQRKQRLKDWHKTLLQNPLHNSVCFKTRDEPACCII